MFKSLFRSAKLLLFACLMLVAGVSVIEVAARGHRLYETLQGSVSGRSLSSAPCSVCYQSLPPLATLTSRHGESGERLRISTNSLGFRGPDVLIPKNSGVFRIICLGDERTLAADVADVETFASRLQEQLGPQRQVEVINAGVPGHCPLLSLTQMRHRMLGLQPDVVILNLDHADAADDERYRPFARFDANGLPHAVVHPAAQSDGTTPWQQLEREFYLAQIFRRHAGGLVAEEVLHSKAGMGAEFEDDDAALPSGSTSGVPVQLRQTLEPIVQLKTLSEQLGGRFLLAIVPYPEQFGREQQRFQRTAQSAEDFSRLVARFARDAQIPMIDPAQDLLQRSSSEDLFLSSAGSLSVEGHRLYAESLAHAVSMLAGWEPPGSVAPARPVSHSVEDPGASTRSAPTQPAPLRSLPRRPRRAADMP